MAHETEAACLLRTGNLYPRRVGLKAPSGDLIFAGLKHGGFSIYFGDEPSYHFDLEGRWQRVFVAGTHHRKALDGSVDAIDRVREGANLTLRRRSLTSAEIRDLDEAIRSAALDLGADLGTGRVTPAAPPEGHRPLATDDLSELLNRVAAWDHDAWFRQRETYVGTYGPLPLLPPDAHQAVLLQATLGHASGRAFGAGQAHPPYTRTPAELEQHARTVAKLLGRRVAQCRAVFLSGGDALHQPLDDVLADFEAVARVFPLDPSPGPKRPSELAEDAVRLAGIDVFLDDLGPPLPDRSGWAQLKARHLGRVNLSIESGDPELRRLYGNTWSDDDLCRTVADLKAEGIPLGLLLLVGAGGSAHAGRHVAATADLVSSLELGRGDLVSLIDATEVGDATLGGRVTPLDPETREAQRAALQRKLDPVRMARGVKVVPYTLEKQWN